MGIKAKIFWYDLKVLTKFIGNWCLDWLPMILVSVVIGIGIYYIIN